MNYLDIIFVLLIAWAGWNGFKKGFIIELFTFLALFLGLYAGVHFSDFVARLLIEDIHLETSYTPVIAFAITFLAVGAMVYFGGKAIEKVIKVVYLSPVNKIAGLGLGIIKMIFFAGGLILILESYDQRNDFIDEETKSGSLLYHPLKKITLFAIPAFKESTMFVKDSLKSIETDSTDEPEQIEEQPPVEE